MKQSDLRPERSDLDRLLNLIAFAAMAGLLGYTLWVYPQLPDRIPIHFNLRGEPDDYGSKIIFLILPGIALALYGLMTIVNRKPQNFNYPFAITPQNAQKQYGLASGLIIWLKAIVMLMMAYLAYGMAQVALGRAAGLGSGFLIIFLGLIFGAIGYYFVQARKYR